MSLLPRAGVMERVLCPTLWCPEVVVDQTGLVVVAARSRRRFACRAHKTTSASRHPRFLLPVRTCARIHHNHHMSCGWEPLGSLRLERSPEKILATCVAAGTFAMACLGEFPWVRTTPRMLLRMCGPFSTKPRLVEVLRYLSLGTRRKGDREFAGFVVSGCTKGAK